MNKNTTYIGYCGVIDFELNYKGKILKFKDHNSGTNYLKQSFARVLSGNYSYDKDVPQLLDLLKKINGEWTSNLYNKIVLTGKKYSNISNDNWAAIFTATISFSDLLNAILESSIDQYRLCIMGKYIKGEEINTFATMSIDSKYLSKIVPGSLAIITWNMLLVDLSSDAENDTILEN